MPSPLPPQHLPQPLIIPRDLAQKPVFDDALAKSVLDSSEDPTPGESANYKHVRQIFHDNLQPQNGPENPALQYALWYATDMKLLAILTLACGAAFGQYIPPGGGGGSATCVAKATTTISYTQFTAAATSQQITVYTTPSAYWYPVAILLNEKTQFTSGSGTVTALAASIGTAGTPTYYVQPLVLMQSSPNFKADNVGSQPASLAVHAIVLQLSVTNPAPGNLGNGSSTNLTAGVLEVAICGSTWQ